MKKLFLVVLAFALLTIGFSAESDARTMNYPSYANAITIDGNGAVNQPPMFIKRVRYGKEGNYVTGQNNIQSGDALIWDTTSADGVTVSCYVGTAGPWVGIAGVAVTTIPTQDVGGTGDITDDNYGYMCVSGWCMAKVDTSAATSGYPLVPAADTALLGYLGTQDAVYLNSSDIGTLLVDSSVDGLMPVWLNLH